MTDKAFESIVEITELHTFYTQFLCNRLYDSFRQISKENVEKSVLTILKENEPIYANYLNLLTNMQYKTLRAIAMEGHVASPNSKEFLYRYNLGAASSVSQAIESLIEKEFLIYNDTSYYLQDKLLKEWIRMKSF